MGQVAQTETTSTDDFDDPFAPYDPVAAAAERTAPASALLTVPAAAQTRPAPISTGKQGTDVPPLTVEMPEDSDEGRFYVIHPDLRDGAYPRLDYLIENGEAFASITTIQGVYDKPTVNKWKIRLTAQEAVEHFKTLHTSTNDERQDRLDQLCRVVKTAYGRKITWVEEELQAAAEKNSRAAAARGTDAHALVEAISKGENPDVPESLTGYVKAYQKFLKDFPDIEYVYVEATVLNRALRTMGTTDAIVRINGRLFVLDYKTNKAATVYTSTGMQLAAAGTADTIVYYDGRQEAMPEISGGIGVGLGPKGQYGSFFFDTSVGGNNYNLFKSASDSFYGLRNLPKDSLRVDRAFFDREFPLG